MSHGSSGRPGGIGLLGALCILFVGLRLAGVIDWPWLVVLAPIWAKALIWVLCVVALAVVEA